MFPRQLGLATPIFPRWRGQPRSALLKASLSYARFGEREEKLETPRFPPSLPAPLSRRFDVKSPATPTPPAPKTHSPTDRRNTSRGDEPSEPGVLRRPPQGMATSSHHSVREAIGSRKAPSVGAASFAGASASRSTTVRGGGESPSRTLGARCVADRVCASYSHSRGLYERIAVDPRLHQCRTQPRHRL